MSPPDRRSRIVGMLVGGAVGDALGAAVEFSSLAGIRRQYGGGGITAYGDAYGGPGRWTDDTQMTLFTVEGLLAAHAAGVTDNVGIVSHIWTAYKRWHRTQISGSLEGEGLVAMPEMHSRRAPGATCLGALSAGLPGTPTKALNDSKGCGGVMRVAPIGVLDQAFDIANRAAAITHGHPTGWLAAGSLAVMVHRLLIGADRAVAVAAGLAAVREHPRGAEVALALESAVRHAESGRVSPETVERLGAGWVAEDALAIGVYAFLVADDFDQAVIVAANHSGDSDSTASIAGQLYGAHAGIDAVDARWQEELELAGVIERLGHELAAAHPETDPAPEPVRVAAPPRVEPAPASRDRFRGAMLGVAVGDCLGAPMEAAQHVPADYLELILTSPPSFFYTDDTAMTIGLAASLLASGGFSGGDMALRFARDYESQPHRGYGGSVVAVFRRVLAGAPWEEAASKQFDGSGSFGNGAAMRVTPVALWAYPDPEATARLAADTARVTHTHVLGVDGAVVQAVAVHHTLAAGDEGPDLARLLADLHPRVNGEAFSARLDELGGLVERGDDGEARRRLGNDVTAHGSVLTALYCFLVSDDFASTIMRAVGMGGDADTIAAMAGAMARGPVRRRGDPRAMAGCRGGKHPCRDRRPPPRPGQRNGSITVTPSKSWPWFRSSDSTTSQRSSRAASTMAASQ